MSDLPEVQVIARLMALAARYGLEELEVEEEGLRVTLQAPLPPASSDADPEGVTPLSALWRLPVWPEAPPKAAGSTRPETAKPLTAPLTGTFYRTETPDTPPLVEVGATVEEGQAVGLIEAMKVFSKVEADRSGVVVEIVAQNGKLVQHGDVILYIDSSVAT
jgi:acetyl-CoA carboxylase biotin carboxyl carrier protein